VKGVKEVKGMEEEVKEVKKEEGVKRVKKEKGVKEVEFEVVDTTKTESVEMDSSEKSETVELSIESTPTEKSKPKANKPSVKGAINPVDDDDEEQMTLF
jgi:hypothetical protein